MWRWCKPTRRQSGDRSALKIERSFCGPGPSDGAAKPATTTLGKQESPMGRFSAFLYGVISYVVFFVSFLSAFWHFWTAHGTATSPLLFGSRPYRSRT